MSIGLGVILAGLVVIALVGLGATAEGATATATGSGAGAAAAPPSTPVTGPSSGAVPSYVPAAYRAWVASAAQGTGLSPAVVAAQIKTESGFSPGVTSNAGAEGIAQFMPGTWASYGHGSPYNPAAALQAYIDYMGSLLRQYGGNAREALAAYNAGPANLAAGYGYADGILAQAGMS